MTRRFKSYAISQLDKYIEELVVTRQITNVQLHHTAIPSHKDYKGESTILAMWNNHVNTRGFRDIAQNFTVAPDSVTWDGRDLNITPAGIAGGNFGSIVIETLGNFNVGMDVLDGSQLYATTKLVALLLHKFKLPLNNDTLVFHRDKAATQCPGTGINKNWFMRLVKIAMDEKTVVKPAWMFDGVEYLHKEKWITDRDFWHNEIQKDAKMPVWAVLNLFARMHRDITKISTKELEDRVESLEKRLSEPTIIKL